MPRFLTLVLFALAVSLAVSGCGGGSGGVVDNTPGASAPYVPLTVGTQWRYDYTKYTQPAAALAAKALPWPRSDQGAVGGSKADPVTVENLVHVTGTQMIDGSPWASIVAQLVGSNPAPAVYARHNSQGFLRKQSLGGAPFYMIHNPIAVGTTWIVSYVYQGSPYQETYEIVALDQTVTVPAGEYTNCLQIENTLKATGQPDDVISYWYAPNVGEIKEERRQGANLVWTMQLKAYTPGTSPAASLLR